MASSKLRERLAELEHDQWVRWAKAVEDEVAPGRRARWQELYCSYSELSEESKDQDREWADKVIRVLKEVSGAINLLMGA